MSNIIIGKYTLESLTSGMYSDPFVVYREYIQNCVDSIDSAIGQKLIEPNEAYIDVQLFPMESRIIIKDNGLGIPSADAERVLVSIGNSKKTTENSRGFRGIGRLSALSYCSTLTFFTSFYGEAKGTKFSINADKLAKLLFDSTKEDVTASEVLRKVYEVEHFSEKEDAHYFTVQMDGVYENSGLYSYEDVLDYLSQTAPVPYNPHFMWGKEITKRLRKEGYNIRSYTINLQYGSTITKIYKPYKDEVLVDKRKNISDKIFDIDIVKTNRSNGDITTIGWIAKTSFLGSIYDKSIKGIRLRKGNILIGDNQTLNVVFKEARFNGWSMGEIFAVDAQLIPNARRDNFEKNSAFFALSEQLTNISASITKEIRTASLKRNAELSKAMEQMDAATKLALEAISDGVTAQKKSVITKRLKATKELMSNTYANSLSDESCQEIAFEELDMLIGKLEGATTYKALNIIDKLTNTEKKILERVFNIINTTGVKNANRIIEAILDEFSA